MRPIVFTILFYSWTTLAGLFAIPLLLGPPGPLLRISRFWSHGALWLLRVITGLSHEVRGQENIPAEPALFAVKHQSAWDTVVINLVVQNAAIVLKRELTWIPLYGWCLLRARHIPIDRSGGLSALRNMVSSTRERLAEGRSIVIFPEGTRVPAGTTVPYHAGIAALQSALDVPVIPVALNSGVYWPRRSLALRPGTIILEFLPPLPRDLPRRDFVQSLEKAIEFATNELIAEAGNIPVDKVVE
ncbi:MAG: lysophospholipid acyltransferase family protein [Alphaproteobacteria bacterium]|jgi:1-acyl-sn-glycerol-3-phosphate acyltransferase|nr:lysophospholipid acyltransferase family protein [Alphaproteobacteria bacterium]